MAVEDIPEGGLQSRIEAPPEARAALAALADVRAVPALSAVFDLTRQGAGVHVSGQVRARVGQTCVVTLEPIENEVDESVDLVFAPRPAGGAAAETRLRSSADDGRSAGTAGRWKSGPGRVATEFLILGIDPYPRKPDAEFAPPRSMNPASTRSPRWPRSRSASGGSRS